MEGNQQTVRESDLVKALGELEDLAKGGKMKMKDSKKGKKELPATQDEANGGGSFPSVGEASHVAPTTGKKSTEEPTVAKAEEESESSTSSTSETTSKAMAEGDSEDGSDKDEGGEGPEDEDSEESESSESPEADTTKSETLADLIKSDTNAGPVVDVSPFIERLVTAVSDSDNQLRKSLEVLHGEQSTYNLAMRKAIVALGNLTLEIKDGLNKLAGSPVNARKSILSKSEISERFDSDQNPQISKSQVLDALCDLAQAGKVSPVDVSRYEVTDTMEPHVQTLVQQQMKRA